MKPPTAAEPCACRLRAATWHDDRDLLQQVRRAVFIVEQSVPEAMEWDEFDAPSLHVLALDGVGNPVGTARLLPDGHVGRMAVLEHCRGRGIGLALLDFLIGAARARGDALLRLNAQTHALGFYARRGFVAHGPEFMDAGIPHRAMSLSL